MSLPSLWPPVPLAPCPPSPLYPSLPPSVLAAFTLVDVNGTSLSRCAAMSPAVRKSTHTPLSVFLRTEPSPFHSPSRSLVSQISRGWSRLSGGTRRPIKYLWINIHSNVWQWEKSCDRKTDMACLCTTCSKGGAEPVLSVCVCVAVRNREHYCGVRIFRPLAFWQQSESYILLWNIHIFSLVCCTSCNDCKSKFYTTVDTKLADVTNPWPTIWERTTTTARSRCHFG